VDAPTQERKSWTAVQAYTVAAVCLFLGIAGGYLLRAPVPANLPAAVQPQPNDIPKMAQVTPDQLKHMADKKVEPLLAQLQKNPKDAKLLSDIGSAYLAARQFESAREYFERSVAAKPDASVLTQLSAAQYFCNDVDNAIATLHRALQLDPKSATALFNLGMLEWQVKSDPNAAIAAWEKLLKVNPNDPNRAQVEQLLARAKRHQAIPPGTKTDKPAM
jgi:cytochrome c-type biogenesis protein CcmH/NrfG